MFLGIKMFGIVIFRYERKFEVQGLVKPGFALFEMSGVKLIMEQSAESTSSTANIHLVWISKVLILIGGWLVSFEMKKRDNNDTSRN